MTNAGKDPAAVALGKKGGTTRWAKIPKGAPRSAIMKRVIAARWSPKKASA